jgi:hypothetical protein
VLFLVGIALAIGAGLAAGGHLNRLAALRVRWLWAVPIAFGAQILAIYGPAWLSWQPAIALILGSHLVLMAVALANVRLAGASIAALGVAMNLAVMVANGGAMPIAPETLQLAGRTDPAKIGDGSPGTHLTQSKDVILRREDTWLEPLADRFWSGLPGRFSVIFSVGDVVLLAGVSALLIRTMTAPITPARRDSFTEESHDTRGTPEVGAAA